MDTNRDLDLSREEDLAVGGSDGLSSSREGDLDLSREEDFGQSRTSKVKFFNRILVYVLGLFFLALGVAFSVNSQLGISPVNSLPYVVSLVTGIEMGTVVIDVFAFYVLLQIVILRKEFQWINLTQILFAVVFGYFVNAAKYLVGDFTIPTYFGQLLMLGLSIVFVALGVSLYVNVKLVHMPMEGLTSAIGQKVFTKMAFADVKVIMDCVVVAAALLLSLAMLEGIWGIREGTVLCAIFVGKLMKPMQKLIVPILSRFCF